MTDKTKNTLPETSTKFFVSPDGTTYQSTAQTCKGHTYKIYHCWHLVKTGPVTFLYKCCACKKHKREYRPGMKPKKKIAWNDPNQYTS
jgi:hypothetical protein